MPKFQSKVIVVDAIQYNGTNQQEVIDFTGGTAKYEGIPFSPSAPDRERGPWLQVKTKEGTMICDEGDYMVKEPFPTGDRDFYPVKKEIFEKRYERCPETA